MRRAALRRARGALADLKYARARRAQAEADMIALLGELGVGDAVKLNLCRGQAGGFCQAGCVVGVALFGSLLDGMGVQGTCEETIEDGCLS